MPQAAPPQAPAVPTGLTATPGNAQVSLQWAATSGATGYNLFRSTSSSLQGDQIATGLTSTTFLNLNLTNGTTYFYRVAATNAGGSSLPSAPVNATPWLLQRPRHRPLLQRSRLVSPRLQATRRCP